MEQGEYLQEQLDNADKQSAPLFKINSELTSKANPCKAKKNL